MKRRKDGLYCVRARRGGKAKDFYAKTIKEARAKADKWRDCEDIDGRVPKDITLEEWASRWLSVYKANKEYYTVRMYRNAITRFILPSLGNIPICKIKPLDVQILLNTMHEKGLTRSIDIVYVTLRQILDRAVVEEIIPKNAVLLAEKPKISKKKKEAIGNEVVAELLKADINYAQKAFIFLLLFTGMRRGELFALAGADIDFQKGIIFIRKSVVWEKGLPKLKERTKSAAGERFVPIVQMLYEPLKRLTDMTGEGFLFNNNGGLLRESEVNTLWRNVKEKLNLQGFSMHSFRHTYCTLLYKSGVGAKEAQKLMGHSTVGVTMDIYTHADHNAGKDAARRIDKMFGGEAGDYET